MIDKLAKLIREELEELKAMDIRDYDLEGKSSLADRIIVASVDNPLTLDSARERIKNVMEDNEQSLKNPTEEWRGGWLIMDFSDIIVNVFLEEKRSFYNLDALLESGKFELDNIDHAHAE